MGLVEFLILLLIAAICGALGQAISGYSSGGLLVSCAPDAVDAVLDAFRSDGFDRAAVVGEIAAGAPGIAVQ